MTFMLSTVKQKKSVTDREYQILQSWEHTQASRITYGFLSNPYAKRIGPTSWPDQGVMITRLVKAKGIQIHPLVISGVSSRLTVGLNEICPRLRLLRLEHITINRIDLRMTSEASYED